jgi:MoaA/NifB/PqqE/SkfB family radical SAM enzyme
VNKVELILWFKCNCRCAFCVVDHRTAAQSMSTADAVRELARARRAGASAVDFGGGEPTLRPDLPKLARAAARLGFSDIGVKTNGLRLCYPEYAARLLQAGARRFSVPVWGASPEEHDALCRTPGAFEKMEMGVKNILDAGGAVELDILLTTGTVPRLAGILEHFAAIGARRFGLWLFCLFGSAGHRAGLLPRLSDAGRAAARAARRFGRRLELSTPHIPPCFLGPVARLYAPMAGKGLVIVTPGGSFPAESSPFEAGTKPARCRGCAAFARCAGVRPEYLERFGSREIVPLRGLMRQALIRNCLRACPEAGAPKAK